MSHTIMRTEQMRKKALVLSKQGSKQANHQLIKLCCELSCGYFTKSLPNTEI